MPLSQAERDKKRLATLRESGGKNVLLRLRREETAALDFRTRYYSMDKGKVVAKIIMEEARRVSGILMSDPVKLREYTAKKKTMPLILRFKPLSEEGMTGNIGRAPSW